MINSSLFLCYTIYVKLACVCCCWLQPRRKLGNFCFSLSISTIVYWKITDQMKFWKLIFGVLYCWSYIKFTSFLRQPRDSVYQNYPLMNTYENWRHMFCTNVYLTTKVEVFNLENYEIKSVLVMLVSSYFLKRWLVLVISWKLT